MGSCEHPVEGVKTPDSLKGIGYTLVAMAILPYLDVCAKFLGEQNLPILQIVWARLFFGSLMALPFALQADGLKAFMPKPAGFQILRGLLLGTATFSFFTALKYMPIADTMAIFYVEPLILVVLSFFLLGEKLDLQRVLAVVVGFLGTLIIIRPGFAELNQGVFFALSAGLSFALYLIVTRKVAGISKAITTTFQTSAIGAIMVSGLMPSLWVMPTTAQWGLMLALAAIAFTGHYLITRAYDHAEASLLAPLAYTEIIMSIFAGWMFFSDLPDRWTMLGIGILVACACYISWRERKLAFEAPTSL